MAAVNSSIKIYCRVKPNSDTFIPYDVLTAEKGEELNLSMRDEFPSTTTQLYLNNKPEQYKFRFSKVFDRTSRQDYIFQEVAHPVIDSTLQGYNGTIFAYGQTGTGKTYTITGSRSAFTERGIIPRTLEYIFQKFEGETNPSKVKNIFVSYLEIYNEVGYDLLNTSTMTGSGRIDDLGRVTLMEDSNQQMHLRNLSVHSIESVEEATQFLYLGDHNRTIAETPLNEVSTRSHCIFTIHLNMRDVHTSLTTRSKLHLVDLAGSERVSTISTTSQLATEARHINLALHYLEQVIVALGDINRSHIPYRNSMMTSVLRDSLGGNCMTSMIATISLDPRNMQETLSTCRFAQRVAMVTNAIQRNEDLDPTIIITQLKCEVKKLREIIESNSMKNMKENTAALTEDELAVCSFGVQQFLADSDMTFNLPIPTDIRMTQECFRLIKAHILSKGGFDPFQNTIPAGAHNGEDSSPLATERNLAQLLVRRDAEIKILMDMIRKEKIKRSQSSSLSPISAKPSSEIVTVTTSPSRSQNVIVKPPQNFGTPIVSSTGRQKSLTEFLIDAPRRVNAFDDTPGEIPDCHHTKSLPDCQTPPPSRAEPSFDQDLTQDFSEAKRIALVTFITKYEGTASLENLRGKLFEKRADIRDLEASISSNRVNIQTMKNIAHATEETDTRLDLSSLSMSMNNQKRTLAEQEERLKIVREEVDDMELVLKAEYKKLLIDFEGWWASTPKIGAEMEQSNNGSDVHHVGSVLKKVSSPSDWLRKLVGGEASRRQMDTFDTEMSEFEERRMDVGEKYQGDDGTNQSKLDNNGISKMSNKIKFTNNFETMSSGLPRYPRTTVTKENQDKYQFRQSTEADTVDSMEDSKFGGIQMTGDMETDQEVLQFLQARKQVFQVIKKQKEEIERQSND